MYMGKKEKERIKVERYVVTTHGSSDKTWLLQFQCPFKALATVLIHLEWGKPMKQKVQWVNKHSGEMRMPKYLPCGGEFYTVSCSTTENK